MEIEDSDEDKEDVQIRPTDNLLIAGKIESEFAQIEVYVFEEETENLYVHHDFILSSFPVCLEWLGADFNKIEGDSVEKGNFAIVGQMNPGIEIWDLNVLDPVKPTHTLNGHQSSTTSLCLHQQRVNLLLSSSDDQSVILWDLQNLNPIQTSKKGESIINLQWYPHNESVYFFVDDQGCLKLCDVRENKDQKLQASMKIESFCPSISTPDCMFITDSMGGVDIFDIRSQKKSKNIYTQIHQKEITGIISLTTGNLITNSLDGEMKLLDGKNLKQLKEMNPKADQLFASSIHPENPYLFACGSSIGEVVIWNYEQLIY